jgi:hypothetical protein
MSGLVQDWWSLLGFCPTSPMGESCDQLIREIPSSFQPGLLDGVGSLLIDGLYKHKHLNIGWVLG